MDYFENTTRITEDGYAAIYRCRETALHYLPCHWNSAGNTVFGTADLSGHFVGNWRIRQIFTLDFWISFFCCCWLLPFGYGICRKKQIQDRIRRTRGKLESTGGQPIHFFAGMYPHDEHFLLGKNTSWNMRT